MAGSRAAVAAFLMAASCRWDIEVQPTPASDAAETPGGGADAPVPPDALACPARYAEWGGSCYFFQDALRPDWPSAEADCESDGGHLIVVDGAAEYDYILGHFPTGTTWLGASDRATEGTYLTVVGQPPAFTSWEPSQPRASDALDCVSVWTGGWRVEDCVEWGYPYGCEIDGLPAAPGAF